MSILSALKTKRTRYIPNRAERRMYWKKNHNKMNLGTWDEFNSKQEKRQPYVK